MHSLSESAFVFAACLPGDLVSRTYLKKGSVIRGNIPCSALAYYHCFVRSMGILLAGNGNWTPLPSVSGATLVIHLIARVLRSFAELRAR